MTYDMIMSLAVWANIIFRLGIMIAVGSIVARCISILEKRDGQKRPRGLCIFCVLLIVGSLDKLWGFLNYEYYRFMFQQFSEQAILLRYIGSIALRLVGLSIATGVILLKDRFRKALLILCLYTLCSLYWKHPFFVFENIARYTEQLFLNKMGFGELTYPAYPWISLIFHYMIDIVFSGSALYYFTRPKVKEHFN